ncbi:MAG: hypothetical protein P9M15_01510 [Candidatus Electryoneaceae bacterium]|nr:hypothetical protein [Candidatus Electryoneaceae bacterium]
MNNPNISDVSMTADDEGKLPFDPATVLIGLWHRRKIFFFIVTIFSIFGVVAAYMFGSKTYEAETVLIFRPVAIEEGETGTTAREDPKSLYTQMNMVKILSNLETTRRRIKMGASPRSIGAAAKVFVQRNTQLLTIQVRWGDPRGAAAIANTLRDVFLENQLGLRHDEAGRQIETLGSLLEEVRTRLQRSADKLQDFTELHDIVDVDTETQFYLQELSSVELLYGQTTSDQRGVVTQLLDVERIINELKRKSGTHQSGLGQDEINRINIQMEQLRGQIETDRSSRVDNAAMAQAELEFQRAEQLMERGLISRAEYDGTRIAFERQQALLEDTDDITNWKSNLANLQQQLLTTQLQGGGSSMLDQMMVRRIDLTMQQTMLAEKVNYLEGARSTVRAKLDRLPRLEREFVEISRDVATDEAERDRLELALSKANRSHLSQSSDFGVIADAKPPTSSRSSNRILYAVGMFIMGIVLGFMLILGLELLDGTIKSAGELMVKIPYPVLGVLGTIPPTYPHFPGQEASAPFEPFNIITRRIRQEVKKDGARILLVSARPGEGKTWIAINMALSMGRRSERVLLSDAQVRSAEEQREVYNQFQKSKLSGKIKESLLIEDSDDESQTSVSPISSIGSGMSAGSGGTVGKEVMKAKIAESIIGMASKLAGWFDKQFDQYFDTGMLVQRSTEDRHDVRDLILYDGKALKGIGEYLSFEADNIADVVWPTMLRGVEILPRFGAAVVPDLLASDRMREFLEEVSKQFSVVLIDGPGVFPFVDADILARLSDAIVFVVRSRYTSATLIRRAVERLEESKVPIIGVILNDVDPIYQEKE